MNFSCEKCIYFTDSKFCFESHKKSNAHKKRENNEFEGKYKCKICNKSYKSNCGFYSHKKKCEEEKRNKDNEEMKNIVKALMKDNVEIKNMLIELSKKENISKIENHTNSHNKIDFHFFLNDKCKNAVNMSTLIETILVTMKDIENLEKQGYVKTVTDMVVEKINNYSFYERPLHYFIEEAPTDADEPNETIHIKDNDKWNTEDPSEHDVLLTNLNTLNDVLQEKTKKNQKMNQEVKEGRRYNKTGNVIKNILENVKIDDNIVKDL